MAANIYSKDQIAKLREGGALLSEILGELCAMVAPGVSTADLDRHAEKRMRDAGGEPSFKGYKAGGPTPFNGTVCTSINHEVVHAPPHPGRILKDGTRDTGCGLKAIPRDLLLRLPVFDSLHRFLPALVRREGYAVVQVDVVDRDRRQGISKYGMWDRLWVGLFDLMGVWWLIRRRKTVPKVRELGCDADRSVADGRELFAGRVRY